MIANRAETSGRILPESSNFVLLSSLGAIGWARNGVKLPFWSQKWPKGQTFGSRPLKGSQHVVSFNQIPTALHFLNFFGLPSFILWTNLVSTTAMMLSQLCVSRMCIFIYLSASWTRANEPMGALKNRHCWSCFLENENNKIK